MLFLTPDCIQVFGRHDHEEETERIIQGRKAFKAIQKQQQQQQLQQQQHLSSSTILQNPQLQNIFYTAQWQHTNTQINDSVPQIKEENLDFNNS